MVNCFGSKKLPETAHTVHLVHLTGVASLTYKTLLALLFCRVPITSILGLIGRTYKQVGFGRLVTIEV